MENNITKLYVQKERDQSVKHYINLFFASHTNYVKFQFLFSDKLK